MPETRASTRKWRFCSMRLIACPLVAGRPQDCYASQRITR
jgi:hypothetical protein